MFDKQHNESRLWHFVWRSIMASMFMFALSTVIAADPMTTTLPQETSTDGNMGEFATSDDVRTATISGFMNGVPFSNMTVQYTMVNGLPIYQGDIILRLGDPTTAGIGLPDAGKLWTDGLMPYVIDPKLPNQERIHDAIAHWEDKTSIRFVERTSDNASQYPNYVRFKPSFGCSSYVGMVGGEQPINLASGCTTGNTIHEIGHALGLWHEHSRADRDEYVDVVYENIMSAYAFNFDKQISNGEDIGEYDYTSIMHYPRWAFSKNGKDTIVPKQERIEIGQRETLTPGDVAAIEYMYDGMSDASFDANVMSEAEEPVSYTTDKMSMLMNCNR